VRAGEFRVLNRLKPTHWLAREWKAEQVGGEMKLRWISKMDHRLAPHVCPAYVTYVEAVGKRAQAEVVLVASSE
jgi:hypothetical protein